MSMIQTDDYDLQVTLVDPSRKIEVYRNLHKKCWSVRQAGLVKFHCHRVNLKQCSFVVQPAGHAKVIREKKKNVHAGLSGYYVDRVPVPAVSFDVTYNPYKYDSFVDTEDHEAQEWSEYAHLTCGDGWRNIEAIFTREYFQEKVKVPA